MTVRKHKKQTNKQDTLTENYELCMSHIRALRNIHTYLVNQQMGNIKIFAIIH
jgi:hypothetical protein